jgi:hypothetical protein
VLGPRPDAARPLPRPGSEDRPPLKQSHSLAEVYAEAERLESEEGPLVWNRGDAIRQHLGDGAADDYLARLALAA